MLIISAYVCRYMCAQGTELYYHVYQKVYIHTYIYISITLVMLTSYSYIRFTYIPMYILRVAHCT